ncbi:hypothetical protein M0805_000456 [Coniferiporia weirii]|nr:hypothetical protein M0805_000456 [Coniferiporia weirii]
MTLTAAPCPIFEPNVLYAVLLYRGDCISWHWALFVPDPATPESTAGVGARGLVCHCTDKNTENRWTYEVISPSALDLRARLVAGARLADLSYFGTHEDVAASVKEILRSVPVRPDAHRSVFNCQTWMLDGVAALHDVGFVHCVDTAALERELISAATFSAHTCQEDSSFVMITSKHCSDS